MTEKDCYEWADDPHAKKRIKLIPGNPLQEAMDRANNERLKHPQSLSDVAAKVERERKHKHGHSGKLGRKYI